MTYASTVAAQPAATFTQPNDCQQKQSVIFCLPKNGRLKEQSVAYIKQRTGIDIETQQVPGVTFKFFREKDIAKLLKENAIDVGIVGSNTFDETFCLENQPNVSFSPVGFGTCRMSLAVPEESSATSIQDLQGAKIFTSYPNQLWKFLTEEGVLDTEISTYDGGVEEIARLKGADAICDIVETGKSLERANMRELAVISQIGARLCCRNDVWQTMPDSAESFMRAVFAPEMLQ